MAGYKTGGDTKFHSWKSQFHCFSDSSTEYIADFLKFNQKVKPCVGAKAVSLNRISFLLHFCVLRSLNLSPEQIVEHNFRCKICYTQFVKLSLFLMVLKRKSNTQKRHCTVDTQGLKRPCELTLGF